MYKNIIKPGEIEIATGIQTLGRRNKEQQTKKKKNLVNPEFPVNEGKGENITITFQNGDKEKLFKEFLKKRQKLLYSSIYIINSINYLNKILSSNTVESSIADYQLNEETLNENTFDREKMFGNGLTKIKPLSNNLILLPGLNTGGTEEKKFEYEFIKDFLKIIDTKDGNIHKFNINIVRPCRDKKDCSKKLEINENHFKYLTNLNQLISIILEDTLEQTLRSFQKFFASSHGLTKLYHVSKNK